MKYMLLIHQGTALETQAALPEAEQKQVWADYAAINQTPGFDRRYLAKNCGTKNKRQTG